MKTQEQYIADAGNLCPVCSSDQIQGFSIEIAGAELIATVEHERGYLDRKYGMGYYGNTRAYRNGYFEIGHEQQPDAQAARREIVARGWLD